VHGLVVHLPPEQRHPKRSYHYAPVVVARSVNPSHSALFVSENQFTMRETSATRSHTSCGLAAIVRST
jgi:hypothetical protein